MNENAKKNLPMLVSSSSIKVGKSNAFTAQDDMGVMNDRMRVKLKPDGKENPYAAANDKNFVDAEDRKKKCC